MAENDLINGKLVSELQSLSKFRKFRDSDSWYIDDSVWIRPVRPQSFRFTDFEDVTDKNKFSYSTLTLNRILTALYEMDFLFMPETSENILEELRENYNKEIYDIKNRILPSIENHVFGFVKNKVKIGGEWNKQSFDAYFNKLTDGLSIKPASLSMTEQSTNKEMLGRFLLMQHALDFLPESSHMLRFAKGDYGSEQSALFRVLLDEFGYGRHEEKHSTLFKECLRSVGMLENSHAYWNFYLNSTLMNNNYFHKITTDTTRFFEYIGAITWAENSFGPYCNMVAGTLRECFDKVDVRYYEEHDHIDGYHGRMTLNELLHPLAERFGNQVYAEYVKGIESCRVLQDLMEEEFIFQITWMEKRKEFVSLAQKIKPAVLADIENIPVAHLNEPYNELSVPHCHDGDEFCIVDEGTLRFCHGPDCFTDLNPGDCVVIQKYRLHGALVISDYCKYRILSIGDYTKYENHNA